MTTLSWGILGVSAIAATFARDLTRSTSGRLVAVASRSAQRAQDFVAALGTSEVTAHGSYAELIANPAVQAVYIANEHPAHAQWTLAAAAAGKHLLVEKPLGVNSWEVDAMIDAAVRHDVFLMEAFMYRCHPQTAKLVELIRSGAIGEVRVIQASFGFNAADLDAPGNRLRDPAQGGGAIMEVGGYPVSLARLVAGTALGCGIAEPIDVQGQAHLGSSGVDEWATATLTFDGGIIAQVATALRCDLDNTVRIHGSTGSLTLPWPWKPGLLGPARIVLSRPGQEPQTIAVDDPRPLYAIEADLVAAHLADRQAPAMRWADSLGNARALERWRAAIGLRYPPEQAPNFPQPLTRRNPTAIPNAPIKRRVMAGVPQPVSQLVMGFNLDPNQAAVLYDAYVEAGGNTFDTSWWYGEGLNDQLLGRWLKSRGCRKEMVICAKGGHTPGCYPEEITRQLLLSLEALQIDCADMYFLHRDNEQIPIPEFVELLNEHQHKGRFRLFGGSNWTLRRVTEFNTYAASKGLNGMVALSNNYSLARMVDPVWPGCEASSTPEYCAWHTATQTPVFAWSSQARGFFARGRPDFTADGELVRSWYSPDNFARQKRAHELATKKGVSPTNIAVAWILAQPFPVHALIGPTCLADFRSSVASLGVQLTPDEVRWLNLDDA